MMKSKVLYSAVGAVLLLVLMGVSASAVTVSVERPDAARHAARGGAPKSRADPCGWCARP